jgi:hypothetical protein
MLLTALPAEADGPDAPASPRSSAADIGDWYTNPLSIQLLVEAAPTMAAEAFDRPASFEWPEAIPEGWATTPYVNYGSYERFHADAKNHTLPEVPVVMYDPERWDRPIGQGPTHIPELQQGAKGVSAIATPVNEQQHPAEYMRRFARLAHRHGYVEVNAPGLNLVSVPGGDCTQRGGESQVTAYLRCNLAGAAAAEADVIDVQLQSIQCKTDTYAHDVATVAWQARTANPDVEILSGLSSGWCHPTGDQLYAAWHAVEGVTGGHFIAIQANVEGVANFFARLLPVIVGDPAFSPPDQVQKQGLRASWRISWSAQEQHSITDRSGLALFDSGLHGAGFEFRHTFVGAGTYAATDTATGATGAISVPVTAEPPAGSQETRFVVQTSTEPAPTDYVYETQIQRPGEDGWSVWRTGAANSFVPDAGAGTYAFRGRLRRKTNGAACGWSPLATIDVT